MKPGAVAHSVSRGAFYLGIEKVISLFASIAYLALISRWLGPTKGGMFALALACIGMATLFTGNAEVYLERYAAEFDARGNYRTLRRAHRLALAIKIGLGLVATTILVAIVPLIAGWYGTPELSTLIPLLSLMIAFDGLSTTGRATLYGIQQFRWISVISVAFNVAKTAIVAMLWYARQGMEALAVSFAVLTVIQGVAFTAIPFWMMRSARDHDPPSEDHSVRGLLRSMRTYCVPMLGAQVTFTSGQNLSKLVIGKLFTMTELGYFSWAFQIIERLIELTKALSDSLLPSFTQLVTRGERNRLATAFGHGLRLIEMVACLVSFAVFAFAGEITRYIGGGLYLPATGLLAIMALVPIARTTQQPITALFKSLRLTRTILILTILKVLSEFGAYFLLVSALGVAGAAWSNVIGAFASTAGAMILLNRHLPDGGVARVWTSFKAVGYLGALIVACLAIERRFDGVQDLGLRVGLVVLAPIGAFALGLVNRYDLDKMSAVPLQAGWMRRFRDGVIGTGLVVARAIDRRREP